MRCAMTYTGCTAVQLTSPQKSPHAAASHTLCAQEPATECWKRATEWVGGMVAVRNRVLVAWKDNRAELLGQTTLKDDRTIRNYSMYWGAIAHLWLVAHQQRQHQLL